MILNFLFFFFGFISFLLASIIAHELGHYIALVIALKKDPKVEFKDWKIQIGRGQMYGLSIRQNIFILINGILMGFFVLLSSIYFFHIIIFICLFVFYLAGSSDDLVNIKKLLKLSAKHDPRGNKSLRYIIEEKENKR